MEPTVFADVDNKYTIAQEEIFGPVLSVIPYADEDQAVALANDSDSASAARCGPPTGSGARPWPGASCPARSGSTATSTTRPPFGGVKASGIGRELGLEGLHGYQVLKTIYLDPSY